VVSPAIAAQPVSRTVTTGSSASFSVTATGTAPLSYQWMKNNANITGATTATYTIASAATTDAGSYSVRVSNSAGSVTSAAATLTVNTAVVAPSISMQPVSQTVNAGANVSFMVTATGTAPLSYQWMKNGAALTGKTTASLVLTSVSTAEAGSYTVKVSNSAGSVTSAAATLTVNPAPAVLSVAITSPTNSQSFIAPALVEITTAVTPSTGIQNVKFFHGTNLLGTATSAPYSLTVSNFMAGTHVLTAKVTDTAGASKLSAPVTISVVQNPSNNPAPTVKMVWPRDYSVFTAPARVVLAAQAADANGTVAKVEFYNGTTRLGTAIPVRVASDDDDDDDDGDDDDDEVRASTLYFLVLNSVPAGSYTVTAVATDNLGASTRSAPLHITVRSGISYPRDDDDDHDDDHDDGDDDDDDEHED
jgi:hypothetical protein